MFTDKLTCWLGYSPLDMLPTNELYRDMITGSVNSDDSALFQWISAIFSLLDYQVCFKCAKSLEIIVLNVCAN